MLWSQMREKIIYLETVARYHFHYLSEMLQNSLMTNIQKEKFSGAMSPDPGKNKGRIGEEAEGEGEWD
jgi:hypothetical protein